MNPLFPYESLLKQYPFASLILATKPVLLFECYAAEGCKGILSTSISTPKATSFFILTALS
jgi:hypothetical protein